MSRVCTVCTHPQRPEIDAAAIAGMSYRNITQRFGVTSFAICRHKADHLLPELVKAHEAEEVANADSLLTEVLAHRARMVRVWDRAEEAGDLRAEIAAGNGTRGYDETLAKLAGLIDARPQVNVWLSPELIVVQNAIADALEPYVEARLAVADALAQFEEQE